MKRWKEAREDKNDPEPPMFYDFDKDAEARRNGNGLTRNGVTVIICRVTKCRLSRNARKAKTDEAFFTRYKEWEKWNDAMADKENPMPDMFAFEKKKQDEAETQV